MTVSSQELDELYREIANPKSWHWKIEERTGWFGHKTEPEPQQHVTEVLRELETDGQQEEAQKLLTALTALYHTFKEENAAEATSAIEAIFGVNKPLAAAHEGLLKQWGFPVDDPAYAPLKAILLECWGELAAALRQNEHERHTEEDVRRVLDQLRQLWDQRFIQTSESKITPRVTAALVRAAIRNLNELFRLRLLLIRFGKLLPLMEDEQQVLSLLEILLRIEQLRDEINADRFTDLILRSGNRGAAVFDDWCYFEQLMLVSLKERFDYRSDAVGELMALPRILQSRGLSEVQARSSTIRLAQSVSGIAMYRCIGLLKQDLIWNTHPGNASELIDFVIRWGVVVKKEFDLKVFDAIYLLTIELFRLCPKDYAMSAADLLDRLHAAGHLTMMPRFLVFLSDKQDDGARRTVLLNVEAILMIIATHRDLFSNASFSWLVSSASTAQELLNLCVRYECLKNDKRYWTVQGLRTLGGEVCHVANAYAGGQAGTQEKKGDPYKNIIADLTNAVSYQPSCSIVCPGRQQTIVRFGEASMFGVFLDYGYIYESYGTDAGTNEIVQKKSGVAYRTGLIENTTRNDEIAPFALLNADPSSGTKVHKYNEVLVRKWTVGGIFFTPNTDGAAVERLKQISRQYSYTEQLNGAYFYRKMPFGTPKHIEKVFPVCELNPDTNILRVVYTPTREEAERERGEHRDERAA